MSWYFELNAANIPNSPFPEQGVETVVNLCGIGSFIGAFVILGLLVHSIHHMVTETDSKDRPLSRRILCFELVILSLFMTSCLGMSLMRCDAIIPGDFTEIGCWLGYYFEVIAYALGKLLTYLFFAYRVRCAFQGTAFKIGSTLKYVAILGILCYSVVIFLQILLLPLYVESWIWLHAGTVKLCIIPQPQLPDMVTIPFSMLPFIDLIFCGYLCYFFVKRLRGIRSFILQLSVIDPDAKRAGQTVSIQTSRTTSTVSNEQSPSVQPVVESNEPNKLKLDGRINEEDKQFVKDIEFLVWKQTILIIFALITTMGTVWWIWILPVLTNLIVFDAVMNAICVHLIFKFCNPFWDMLKKKCCGSCESCDNNK